MNFFKKFDDWNTRNKDMSVSAEQYTIIREILEDADSIIQATKREIIRDDAIITACKSSLSEKDDIIKDLQHYLIILTFGLIVIIVTYGSIIYLSVK
jgi:hypothetical protein